MIIFQFPPPPPRSLSEYMYLCVYMCSIQGDFVAAFAQANEGDASPNTRGAHCTDTGLPCDNIQSTCDGKVSNFLCSCTNPSSSTTCYHRYVVLKVQNCIATGPGEDIFDSTRIIGEKQYTTGKVWFKYYIIGVISVGVLSPCSSSIAIDPPPLGNWLSFY